MSSNEQPLVLWMQDQPGVLGGVSQKPPKLALIHLPAPPHRDHGMDGVSHGSVEPLPAAPAVDEVPPAAPPLEDAPVPVDAAPPPCAPPAADPDPESVSVLPAHAATTKAAIEMTSDPRGVMRSVSEFSTRRGPERVVLCYPHETLMTRSKSCLSIGFGIFLAACGNTTAQSGASGGDGGSAGAGTRGGSGCHDSGVVNQDFVGVWKGYVEGHAFDDGKNTVTLSVDSVTGGVSGHIQFGARALLPPPTDPDVGYPPGIQWLQLGALSGLVSGFAYTLEASTFDGERLQFQAPVLELWGDWCILQTTSYNVGLGYYACVPNWPTNAGGPLGCEQTDPDTGETVDVDCGKVTLCSPFGACNCSEQGCGPNEDRSGPTFELQFGPSCAEGVVGGLDGNVHDLHLTKQ